MPGRIAILTLALLAGCTDLPTDVPRESTAPKPTVGTSFDAKETGTITGQVRWNGDVPTAAETIVRAHATNPYLFRNPAKVTLPHYPKVDKNSQGVEYAVVFLRKVDPQRCKPWHHAPAQVEFQGRRLLVSQGGQHGPVGIAQPGSTIELVNRDTEYHNLLVRGAAFFAEPLIEKDHVRKRTLPQPGIVDLSSANGYYWLHAHLFVAEHPYYTRTDATGQFTLDQVPTGTYELVCWLPSWHIRRKEHDPETGTLTRLQWAPPQEQTRTIDVRAGEEVEALYYWASADFK